MAERNSFTYKLSDEEQSVLIDILKNGNYRPLQVEHTKIAAQGDNCTIALYKSGKCLVQGKGAADFVTFMMEPLVLQKAGLGYEDILNPEALEAHLGVDESGKGDFFGPLVAASAYIDKTLVQPMRDMNVRDSKTITSDNKALEMGRDLKKLLGKRFSLIIIGPQAYNRLYYKMRNVNSILAWAHARAIENLLEVVPDCSRAISDQFGAKYQVEQALMKKGRGIKLIQKPRAEEDLAVAAASILARSEFLMSLRRMDEKYKIHFPKGASPAVKDAAIQLIKANKPEILLETAKCHFKTADVVLKELNKDRSCLGPEGSVKSKPGNFKRH